MNSAYDVLDMGKKGFEWLFESEIKIGRYLMTGGTSAKPTSMDCIMTAMNFVGISSAAKIGKLGWKILMKKPIGVIGKLVPFGAKEIGITGAAMGYGALTKGSERGVAEAYWGPSGMAPMAIWGGVKESAEALTKPIGAALRGGHLDLAEQGIANAREQRKKIVALQKLTEPLTPEVGPVGEWAIKSLDRTIAKYQKSLDHAKYVMPNIKHQQEQLDEEQRAKQSNIKALESYNDELNKLNTIEQRVLKARFTTPAEIGGIKVDSELAAMESVWGQNMDMMTTERAMLIRADPYARHKGMVSAENLHSKGAKLQIAKLNLGFVRATTGTESKDRAMVALQQAHAQEQLRSAQSELGIETERQKAEAGDTLAVALEKQQLLFQASQIDFQLAYSMQHELVMMTHAKQQDASSEQPKTLEAVKDKLTELWAEQSTLETSVTDYASKIKGNEETAVGYAKQLVELEKEYIDPLELSMSELNNLIRMM